MTADNRNIIIIHSDSMNKDEEKMMLNVSFKLENDWMWCFGV
ncbi:hypothetical protein [Ructibacterium gallinarum]|nr:hypothetical protein [Ructibacterium gallinarum]